MRPSSAHRTRPRTATSGRLLVVAALLVLVGLTAPPAPAGGTEATLVLQPTSGPAGTAVDAAGSGFPAGLEAILRLDDPTGPVLVDGVAITAKGTFETAFVVPRGTPVGDHLIQSCVRRSPTSPETCDRLPSPRFRVTAPTTTSSTTSSTTTSTTVGTATTAAPPGQVGVTTAPPTTVAPPTTARPDELASATTTTRPPHGVGALVGPPTTHGLGLGELVGSADVPDLSIVGIEITQGIQNLANKMPLVAGRTTVLRVYVKTDGGDMSNVSGAVQLVRNGTQEVAVIEPDNGPLTVTGADPDRLDADGSLNFTLPPTATHATTQGDRLIVTAFVFGTHPTAPASFEPTDVNNYKAGVFDFQNVGPFIVHTLPMHMHELPTPSSPNATVGTSLVDLFSTAATLTSLYRYMPVHDIQHVPGPVIYPPMHGAQIQWLPPSYFTEWDLTLDGVESSILAAVQAVWAETSTTPHLEQYYGIYRSELPRVWGGFSNGTVAYGFVHLLSNDDWPWYHVGGWLAAHELGHSIGFDHVGCTGTESNPGDYPWSDPCLLAPTDPAGWYGWDVRHTSFAAAGPAAIGNDPADDASNGYPYMGYQGPKWADPWHYCRSLKRFGGTCAALSIPENQIDLPDALPEASQEPYVPAPDQAGWLKVEVLLSEPEPLLLDLQTVAEPLPHVLEDYARRRSVGDPTDVVAQLVDADGAVLSELALVSTSEGAAPVGPDGDDTDLAPADASPPVVGTSDYLRWYPTAAAVRLLRGSAVAAERTVSTHPPQIQVVAPAGGELTAPLTVAWEASDPEGDPLAFDLAYSPDGGTTWRAVAHLVTDTSYTFEDFSTLGGGEQAVFRVTARDGVHATSATSVPAVLADQPPSVLILSPGDGQELPLHAPVTLHASASDLEDGPDAPPQVAWTSSLDGPLGTGSHIVARTLSAGDHEITATAIDSSGGASESSVTITVDAERAVPRLDEEGYAAALAALRDGPVSELELASTRGASPAVWASAVLAALAILAAGAAVRRARQAA